MSLAITSGMRRGEMLGLRWDDVRLDEGMIQLDPKGNKAGRADLVALPTATIKHLKKIQDVGLLVFPLSKRRMDPSS